MIKISKLTDYAVVTLSIMAGYQDEKLSAAQIAEQGSVPEPTTSKILKMLSKTEIVESIRGVHGGYRLNVVPDELPLSSIIEAIEGPIALTACVSGSHDECAMSKGCSMNGRWTPVNQAVKAAFESITLKDMMGTSCGFKSANHAKNVVVQSVEMTMQS